MDTVTKMSQQLLNIIIEVHMETDKKYFQVGVFVIGIFLAGIGFTLQLTSATSGDYNRYFIRFSESVSGLNRESTVKFHGVDVGNVEKISIDPNDPKLIHIDICVLQSTPIKTDTTATLKLYGITGEVYIELSGGSIDAPRLDTKKINLLKLKPGQVILVLLSMVCQNYQKRLTVQLSN